jgi:predicted metal-binding membrane protein
MAESALAQPRTGGSSRARIDGSSRARLRIGVGAPLLLLAAIGWWWSVRMVDDMADMGMGGDALSFAAFLLAWAAMMGAMMFPAVSPVVMLYGRAAARHTVAPLPFFVSGYLVVWTAMGVPAYLAWRELAMPIHEGSAWVARLAGVVLLVAAVWQLTPLKSVCLRHCRSPIGFFLRGGRALNRPVGALRMGVAHGAFCLGCCWALMAVLVALGTMNILWMVLLSVLIILEKNAPHGEAIAVVGAGAFAVLGLVLLVDASTLAHIT